MNDILDIGIPFRDLHFVMKDIQLYSTTLGRSDEYQTRTAGHRLLLITGGHGTLTTDNGLVRLQRGKCIHLSHEARTVMAQKSDEPLLYYMLTYSITRTAEEDVSSAACKQPSSLNGLFPDGEVKGLSFQLLEERMNELLSHAADWSPQVQMQRHFRFQSLMYLVLEHNVNQTGAENAKAAVERTIHYVQEHYQEVTHIEQLAQMANMSRRWYNILFKEITGQSPTDYLTGIRIRRAKELLHISGNRLYDIAREVGFSDEHYFSRRFKQSVGFSPRQYVMNRRHVGISVTYPELLYSIGVTPIAAPVGYDDFPSYLREPFANVMRLSCSNEPDYESIRIARPDFILAPVWKDQQNYEALSRIATTVLLPERDDWRDELRDMAEVLGKRKEAGYVIQNYESSIAAARERLHAMIQGESVVYMRITGDEAFVYGAQSSRGRMLHQELGLRTVQALQQEESALVMSMASLSALNADHIILHIDQHRRGTQEAYKQWIASGGWNELSSFKRKQIYPVGGMEWFNFSFSPLATCRAIEELIHRLEKEKR
jgi:AraC family transcriptional regulator, transcriptional activator for feuABC-ybbA operon